MRGAMQQIREDQVALLASGNGPDRGPRHSDSASAPVEQSGLERLERDLAQMGVRKREVRDGVTYVGRLQVSPIFKGVPWSFECLGCLQEGQMDDASASFCGLVLPIPAGFNGS